jgi:hypothetical protein
LAQNLTDKNITNVGAESSSDRSNTTEERGGVTTDMKELQPDMALAVRFVYKNILLHNTAISRFELCCGIGGRS